MNTLSGSDEVTKELEKFEERFEDITEWSKTSEYRETERLSELMTEMERAFQIPLLNDEKYNKNNSEVILLYRRISEARTAL